MHPRAVLLLASAMSQDERVCVRACDTVQHGQLVHIRNIVHAITQTKSKKRARFSQSEQFSLTLSAATRSSLPKNARSRSSPPVTVGGDDAEAGRMPPPPPLDADAAPGAVALWFGAPTS